MSKLCIISGSKTSLSAVSHQKILSHGCYDFVTILDSKEKRKEFSQLSSFDLLIVDGVYWHEVCSLLPRNQHNALLLDVIVIGEVDTPSDDKRIYCLSKSLPLSALMDIVDVLSYVNHEKKKHLRLLSIAALQARVYTAIRYVEFAHSKITLHLRHSTHILFDENPSNIPLNDKRFMPVSDSVIINLENVSSIHSKRITLNKRDVFFIHRSYLKEFFTAFMHYVMPDDIRYVPSSFNACEFLSY